MLYAIVVLFVVLVRIKFLIEILIVYKFAIQEECFIEKVLFTVLLCVLY